MPPKRPRQRWETLAIPSPYSKSLFCPRVCREGQGPRPDQTGPLGTGRILEGKGLGWVGVSLLSWVLIFMGFGVPLLSWVLIHWRGRSQ